MRSISSRRHCVSTWIVTSSGIRSSSISWRTKSKSGCEADGKPTSISLKPIATRALNICSLRAGSIGSMRAWLPSRRSTEHQIGRLLDLAVGPLAVGKAERQGAEGYVLARPASSWAGLVREAFRGSFFVSAGSAIVAAGLAGFVGETKTSCAGAGGSRRAPGWGSPQVRSRLLSKRFLFMVGRSVACGAQIRYYYLSVCAPDHDQVRASQRHEPSRARTAAGTKWLRR